MEHKEISIEELKTKYKTILEKKPRQRGSRWRQILAKVENGKPQIVEGARVGQVAGLRQFFKRNQIQNIIMLTEPTGEDPTIKESKNKNTYRILFITKTDYEKLTKKVA